MPILIIPSPVQKVIGLFLAEAYTGDVQCRDMPGRFTA